MNDDMSANLSADLSIPAIQVSMDTFGAILYDDTELRNIKFDNAELVTDNGINTINFYANGKLVDSVTFKDGSDLITMTEIDTVWDSVFK